MRFPRVQRSPLLIGGVVFLFVALIATALVWRSALLAREDARARALNDVSDRAASVQVTLDRALSASYALGAMVHPESGGIPNFQLVAAQLLPFYPGVAALQLAPGGVVRDVYPLSGNEQAIGHDLLADPARSNEALRARESGQLTLAGPFKLVQGGVGVVGRLPLYAGAVPGEREHFWGFAVVLLKLSDVLQGGRLEHLAELGYRYRLWKVNPDSGAEQVIAASAGTTGLEDPVSYVLQVPNGSWALSVEPLHGWWNPERMLWESLFGLLCSGVLAYLAMQMVELRLHRQSLQRLVDTRTRDLQQEVAMHRETAQRLQRVSSAVEQSSSSIVITDLAGNIEYVNPAFLHNTGYREDEVLGQNPRLLKSGKTVPERYREMWHELTQGRAWSGEFINRRKNGSEYVELATIAPVRRADGQVTHYVAVKDDITQRKRAEEDLRIAALAFETQEGLVVTDRDGIIQRVNRAFTEMTGYAPEEVIGRRSNVLKSGRHDEAFYHDMWHSVLEHGYWQGEIWDKRKNGEIFPEWLSIAALRDDEGKVTHFVGGMSDITQRKAAEDEIHNLAFFDPLTQLPNRRLLMERLHIASAQSARMKSHFGILFIDLDDFKSLNDTQGHHVGDLLLLQVAARLRASVEPADTVARLGGDEFVVLRERLGGNALEAGCALEALGEQVRDRLGQDYRLGGHAYHSSPSIGALVAQGTQVSIEELLKRADLALYQAKAAGRNSLRFFDPEMQAAAEARAALESELRAALRGEDEIVLYYQPQVNGYGDVTGVEALVRWLHPERGVIPPDLFVPLAEEVGLIEVLGERVMELACRQLVVWQGMSGFEALTVAVNVSAHEFRQADFLANLDRILSESGANPERLRVELTESVLLEDVELVIEKMNLLRARGIRLSLDDFGTGYSSLMYLKRLPLDRLKIDQSFVRDILDDPNDAAIASMIIALADQLKLGVIAEGVETEKQRACLMARGCHAFQGFLFSQPLPLHACTEFVRRAADEALRA